MHPNPALRRYFAAARHVAPHPAPHHGREAHPAPELGQMFATVRHRGQDTEQAAAAIVAPRKPAKRLHVFTARANPLGWEQPHRLYEQFAAHMLESGVVLHVVECAYGDRPFTCALPGVHHIGVRAKTMIWNKECLLNLGIMQVPEAEYIAWIDADIFFRNPTWADDTLDALDLYDVVQPWSHAHDLGPKDELMTVHTSFAKVLHDGGPVAPNGPGWWKGDGGPYVYPHSGYAWAMTRRAFDGLGGLFDLGGMGSGDFHMAQALVGEADCSIPGGAAASYRAHVKRWEARAKRVVDGNVGYVRGTIEHGFHGSKPKRNYLGRWDMFVKHQFCPDTDLIRNAYGVYELAPGKPELRRDFDRYLRHRDEDATSL